MTLVTRRELRQLMHIHYITELLLSFLYVIFKYVPFISNRVFGTNQFNSRETELLMFTFIVIAFNTRRRGHVNFLPYLSCACTSAKLGNSILFFFTKPIYGLSYTLLIIGHMIIFPKPKYKGPENITYFLGDEFEKELAKDKTVKWLVEFYVTWNPDCNEFAGLFSELSAKFSKDNFRFGKIDVARSPNTASKYNITSSVTSRTLPSLIMFKNGREHMRRPLMDTRNRIIPFSFSYENIVSVFGLE